MPSPVGIADNSIKNGNINNTTNVEYINANKLYDKSKLTAFKKVSTKINNCSKNDVTLENIVVFAKLPSPAKKSTELSTCPQLENVGISNKTQIPIAIILYNKSFQKTEKFAINNFTEFLNIIYFHHIKQKNILVQLLYYT